MPQVTAICAASYAAADVSLNVRAWRARKVMHPTVWLARERLLQQNKKDKARQKAGEPGLKLSIGNCIQMMVDFFLQQRHVDRLGYICVKAGR